MVCCCSIVTMSRYFFECRMWGIAGIVVLFSRLQSHVKNWCGADLICALVVSLIGSPSSFRWSANKKSLISPSRMLLIFELPQNRTPR